MNNKQFDYGMKPYSFQSNLYLDPLSIFVLSIHHCSHHEHPAH